MKPRNALRATPNNSHTIVKSIVEQGKKHRLVLIAGIIAAILTYFMAPTLAQYGLFNHWHSIKSPPSGAAKILGVTGGTETQEVWINTHNGQIFSSSICRDDQKCDLPQWKLISKAPNGYFATKRGTDCKKLGDLTLNPSGQFVECVYYAFNITTDGIKNESYFVLMRDGSLKYLAMNNLTSSMIVSAEFILITHLLYFVMLLFIFRLTRYIAKQIQIKKENTASQA